jgi:hypothetical protein
LSMRRTMLASTAVLVLVGAMDALASDGGEWPQFFLLVGFLARVSC